MAAALALALLASIGFQIELPTSRVAPLLLPGLAIAGAIGALVWTVLRRLAASRNANRQYRDMLNALTIGILELDLRPAMAELARLQNAGVADIRTYLCDNPEFTRAAHRLVRITDANAHAMHMLGLSDRDVPGDQSIACLSQSSDTLIEFFTALEQRKAFQTESRFVGRNGELVEILASITIPASGPLHRVPATIVDVTERNRLNATVETMRAQLERAQRAIVLGHLSAAIAHEINQPLGAVRTYAAAGTRWLDRPQPDVQQAKEAMYSTITAVDHVHTVIDRIRTLIGGHASDLVPLDLDCVLQEMAPLLHREAAAHRSRIEYDLRGGGEQVLADAVLIQQVVVNLVSNALQAMEDVDCADRTVKISHRVVGDRCELTVADRGRGIPDGAMSQRTEPFQTTKVEGMGLGLAICRSAVEAHHGTLTIGNRPDGGAIVTVTIPGIVSQTEEQAAQPAR